MDMKRWVRQRLAGEEAWKSHAALETLSRWVPSREASGFM